MALEHNIRHHLKVAYETKEAEKRQAAIAAEKEEERSIRQALVDLLESRLKLSEMTGHTLDYEDTKYVQTLPPYATAEAGNIFFAARPEKDGVYGLRCMFYCSQCCKTWFSSSLQDRAELYEILQENENRPCRDCRYDDD